MRQHASPPGRAVRAPSGARGGQHWERSGNAVQGCRLCRPHGRSGATPCVSPPYALYDFRGTFFDIMSKLSLCRGALGLPMAHLWRPRWPILGHVGPLPPQTHGALRLPWAIGRGPHDTRGPRYATALLAALQARGQAPRHTHIATAAPGGDGGPGARHGPIHNGDSRGPGCIVASRRRHLCGDPVAGDPISRPGPWTGLRVLPAARRGSLRHVTRACHGTRVGVSQRPFP